MDYTDFTNGKFVNASPTITHSTVTTSDTVQVAPAPQGACPNCGYCPHCGRAAQPYRMYPWGVEPWPYTPSPMWIAPYNPTWIGAPGNGTLIFGQASWTTSDGTH